MHPGGGRKIHVVSSDTRLNVVLTWEDGNQDDADLVVVAPGGLVVTSANYRELRGVKYRRGARYAFFTIDLPLAGRRQGTWYGYPVNLGSGGVVRALLVSGLDVEASTTERFLYTGEPITFTSRVVDRGRPVSGLTVTVTSDQPLYAYGNVMAQEVQYAASPLQGDPVPDTQAKMDALLRQGGAGLLPRETSTFVLREDAAAPGTYANSLFTAANPGSYHFTVSVGGLTPDGDYCVRYLAFTKVVRTRLDSASSTFVLTPAAGAANRYTLAFTPIDRLGNLMGPGYGGVIRVSAPGAKLLGPVKDLNNGTYTVPLALDPAAIATTTVSIAVKDQVIAVPKQVLVSAVDATGHRPEGGWHGVALWIAVLALVLAILALIVAVT
jgi:hypothetical protein